MTCGDNSVYIIAEVGVNHNGSIDMAKRLIDVAAKAGVNAVKFQTFKAERLATNKIQKAPYQQVTTDHNETQLAMLKKYELDSSAHKELLQYCTNKSVNFLSSAFDKDSLELLVKELDLDCIKFGSGEITNAPLLLQAAQFAKKIILSTGMTTLAEIEAALAVLTYGYIHKDNPTTLADCYKIYFAQGKEILRDKVALLHCTTEYPAPSIEVNLNAISTMQKVFDLNVGFSDHTEGIYASIAAVAKGATIIEKHITLDSTLPGPDHRASIEPNELQNMVKAIRQVELLLGDGNKIPTASEIKNKNIVRKSLVAIENIEKGELFSPSNLGLKRAGCGISGMQFWELLGKQADRDYKINEVIIKS